MAMTKRKAEMYDWAAALEFQAGVARALADIVYQLLETGSEHDRLHAIERLDQLREWLGLDLRTPEVAGDHLCRIEAAVHPARQLPTHRACGTQHLPGTNCPIGARRTGS